MSSDSYINYDAIKKDLSLNYNKTFFITYLITALIIFSYIRDLQEKNNENMKTIDELSNKISSLQEDVSLNKDEVQKQIGNLSDVTSTNVDNISLLAKNTNTRIGAVKKSIDSINENILSVNSKVSDVEKRARSIEERTKAIEQAVDMPGANPLDSLITNYNQSP